MKRFFICLIFCSSICFSQEWTEGDPNTVIYEYTVITRDQYLRLLEQYKASNDYCLLEYIDALERRPLSSGRVISGTRPTFNGSFFIIISRRGNATSYSTLIYGNTNTGRMELTFTKGFSLNRNGPRKEGGSVSIASNDYLRLYNQYTRWVNGQ